MIDSMFKIIIYQIYHFLEPLTLLLTLPLTLPFTLLLTLP